MPTKKTLGGDRLGAGNKMKVELHGYERSTHDLGYLWRSTMSAGTLVPFMKILALPGDTFDINLDCEILTHPTVGPLFGSDKVQLDVFQAPIRLYQGQLHNNKLGIGMNMANILLPQLTLHAMPRLQTVAEPDNWQINPSCILAYLGIMGVGSVYDPLETTVDRDFNAIPFLAYWDIYKNYYANKQEEQGAVIHNANSTIISTITTIEIGNDEVGVDPVNIDDSRPVVITFAVTRPLEWQIYFQTSQGRKNLEEVADYVSETATTITLNWKYNLTGNISVYSWEYLLPGELPIARPNIVSFQLDALDLMREEILSATQVGGAFIVNDHTTNQDPYDLLLNWVSPLQSTYMFSQQGLAIKTYQSDLFNNWLSTEWIDGAQGINEITRIDTSAGFFNIDALNIGKKVYDMLNRIAVSGGSYDDWLDAVYDHPRAMRAETPIYHGGLIKELIFQEVVSNAETSGGENGTQPLGTLGGRGIMAKKHKGGRLSIKIDEPSYLIGIISITPRIDYSQGNEWDTQLKTMDDLHKPALDEIGFQELITEQMAWWDTQWDTAAIPDPAWVQKSAGKQPAWINYMTNINQVKGNFAIRDNEMFMTLNRRFEYENLTIADLTTYIDPIKFNHIFADTALDAQNFWTQIAVDITARRKMSAKLMPNL